MMTISDYEHYLNTRETPYDKLGHRLYLQLYINDAGRDHVIKQLSPEVSWRWLDELIDRIEDMLIDGDEREFLQTGKGSFRPLLNSNFEIDIEISHVGVRAVSTPPMSSRAWDEMMSRAEAKEFEELR